jgi:hypothetical protein
MTKELLWLSNLKAVKRVKTDFVNLKYSFCRPLDSAALGGGTNRPLPQ